MTPREIVSELDKHIVGQGAAKRAVAIALRNRWRRMQIEDPLRQEITPKNILMIGPTGCGKTEIARRLARLANAPFVKVEATKFTEVGYVGREVDSIVKDLAEVAVKMTREEEIAKVRDRAADAAEERLLDALLPHPKMMGFSTDQEASPRDPETRQKFRKMLREGAAERTRDRDRPARHSRRACRSWRRRAWKRCRSSFRACSRTWAGNRTKPRKLKVKEAQKLLVEEEAGKLVNEEELRAKALIECRAERHRVHRRDRQDRAPPGNHRRRRVARRRAARPAAAGRRQHRVDQVRPDQDRPRPVHRLRRVPHVQALGSDSGAAGPLPDPRGARFAEGRRLRAHPHRARCLADHAVQGAAGHREGGREVRRQRRAPHRRDRVQRERENREHRRAPPAHRDGAAARDRVVRCGGKRRQQRSRSTPTYVDEHLGTLAKDEDLSRYIL